MSDSIDYSDEYEEPLKYEQTQNRDMMKTIERINRAEKFKDSASKILMSLKTVLNDNAAKEFKNIWRNRFDEHDNPKNYSIVTNVYPPLFKKFHAEGDTDTDFKRFKEYPFYYLMNLEFVVVMKNSYDMFKGDDAMMQDWFHKNISDELNKKIISFAKDELAKWFNNVFSYPSLKTIENKEVNGGIKCDENRINITSDVILKISNSVESNTNYAPFVTDSNINEIGKYNISMALERIIRV